MIYRLICLACLIAGYFFGSVHTTHFICKAMNVDIRKEGSGNLGATNTFRILGVKPGLIAFFGDMIKVFVAVGICYFVIINRLNLPIDRIALTLYVGLGTVLGHNFPFYLGFKGGKGVAASAAALIALLDWRIIVIGFIVFFGLTIITRYVSLGSMSLLVTELIVFILFTQIGLIDVTDGWLTDCYVILVIMTALCIFQHRENIMRLISGTENKFYAKSKKELDEEQQAKDRHRH
ncbi:MAG: glycerol-3-phosphate 1-O-acyltransferase PlsY [Lachnospiraceae bacterium]|jgi:glycerol-3-phosphate acyltransferase PlsY